MSNLNYRNLLVKTAVNYRTKHALRGDEQAAAEITTNTIQTENMTAQPLLKRDSGVFLTEQIRKEIENQYGCDRNLIFGA